MSTQIDFTAATKNLLAGLDTAAATKNLLAGLDTAAATKSLSTQIDFTAATKNLLAGLDTAAATKNLLAGLDTAAATKNLLAGLDTAAATKNLLAGLDTAAATKNLLAGLDTAAAIRGLSTQIDFTAATKNLLAGLDTASTYGGDFLGVAGGARDADSEALDALGSSKFAASYRAALDSLLDQLNVSDTGSAKALPPPTPDGAAFQMFTESAPQLAAAIDEAAEGADLPLWQRTAVRNGLAWSVVTVIVTVYIVGAFLPPPYGGIAVGVLSSMGVSAPAAYKLIRGDQTEPPTL